MKSLVNCAGGVSIYFELNEPLTDVPETHQGLISTDLRDAFANPRTYFESVANQSKLPGLQRLIADLLRHARPSLLLATAKGMFGSPVAGIQWWSGGDETLPHYLILEPGQRDNLDQIPSGLRELYSVLRSVHWEQPGYGGGLFREGKDCSVEQWDTPCQSDSFPTESSIVFGSTGCGDMLIYNSKGEAGFLSHETGDAYSLGSLTEALNWIFDELRQGREPEFDYERT